MSTSSDRHEQSLYRNGHLSFKNAGQTEGLEMWRIERFKPVAYPKTDYGKFYDGDTYIVLNTKRTENNDLFHNLHFWKGLKSTEDKEEAGTLYTVQLMDMLKGTEIQRESQNIESTLFLSYFKNRMEYLQGGYPCGFKEYPNQASLEDEEIGKLKYKMKQRSSSRRIKKRLLYIKGGKVMMDSSEQWKSKGTCFILKVGLDIFVYVPNRAKKLDKWMATEEAGKIRDRDHNGRGEIFVIDQHCSQNYQDKFFEILAYPRSIAKLTATTLQVSNEAENADSSKDGIEKFIDDKKSKNDGPRINRSEKVVNRYHSDNHLDEVKSKDHNQYSTLPDESGNEGDYDFEMLSWDEKNPYHVDNSEKSAEEDLDISSIANAVHEANVSEDDLSSDIVESDANIIEAKNREIWLEDKIIETINPVTITTGNTKLANDYKSDASHLNAIVEASDFFADKSTSSSMPILSFICVVFIAVCVALYLKIRE